MSEKKQLKLQLPYHHVYDSDYDLSEAFEAPRSNNFVAPVQRRKPPKSVRPSADTATANIMVPDTPPTPDSNSKLYPFLRLHRKMSSSAPDVTRVDQRQSKSSINRSEIEAQLPKNTSSQNGPVQLNNLDSKSGSTLSNAVVQKGLTASASANVLALDHRKDNGEKSSSTCTTPTKEFVSTERIGHDNASPIFRKRQSLTSGGGFLTNLIFGNNLFDGKPLKVSGFDMSMCAPGST